MTSFFNAIYGYQFLQYALIAGLLCSVSCGVIGTYVVIRRITYIAGAITHSTLGGMGLARYLQVVHGLDWFSPILGAIITALIAAIIIGLISIKAKQREDTVISAIWAIGMAVGILFISQTPGYSEDLMSYLFGNILMVTQADLILIAVLDIIVVLIALIFYQPLRAVCFDEEFARLRNINVEIYYLLLLCLTALTVVILTTVVGIVLVIALISLPVAIAGRFTRSIVSMMVVSLLLCIFFTTTGLAFSFINNLPAGPSIILILAIVYIAVFLKKQK